MTQYMIQVLNRKRMIYEEFREDGTHCRHELPIDCIDSGSSKYSRVMRLCKELTELIEDNSDIKIEVKQIIK